MIPRLRKSSVVPALTVGVTAEEVANAKVSAVAYVVVAAFAGATDRTPAPNAATATSAMRL
jgi:hypothetical protein